MDSIQRYKINNWQEILNLVKIEYVEFFKEFHDYIEHIQNMLICGFLDSQDILPSPLFKERKEKIYYEVLEELKKRNDYSKFEYWLEANANDYEKFCEYVINLKDKTLACLLIFEKVYHPKKEKRLDYYRYRKRLMEYDWYKVPVPFIDTKKVCFSCGNKYPLFMEKFSDTRKDISLRECPKCNYSPNSLKYNLQMGYDSEGNYVCAYFNGYAKYINMKEPMDYQESPKVDFNKLDKKREEFKSKVSKIISKNLLKEEVVLNWSESDKYDEWYQFDREKKKLDENSKELILYLKNHPSLDERKDGDIVRKFIESNKLYTANIPFIKVVYYDTIEVDSLADLIIENLILFKLKDETIEKLKKPFSLKDWTYSGLVPYQKFPNDIRVPGEYEILVNGYFIKNFNENKNTRVRNNFSGNNLSKPAESIPTTIFEKKYKPEIRRLSINMQKNPIYDNNRRPLYSEIRSTKKDVIIKANVPYKYNLWKQNDGSLTLTFVPIDEIVESKKISYCDLDENTQNTLMEFQSAMNDEQSREDFFKIDDDTLEDPFSKDEDDEEVPF
ncbi:hypothetical protein [Aquimarina algiphila]|uniref:hypothetical protein n=1 Tax=Aquimarina algiphila TaxID=2047982 RepID=UPI0024904F84|nr:hypothetical protein [Aquimarina algiphila]